MKIQQGDVILKKVDSLPENYQKLDHLVLAEGEATGHHHQIVNGQAELLNANGILFLKIISKIAELQHEEHKNIVLEKGLYKINQVREWDYEQEEARYVRD